MTAQGRPGTPPPFPVIQTDGEVGPEIGVGNPGFRLRGSGVPISRDWSRSGIKSCNSKNQIGIVPKKRGERGGG